MSDVEPPPTDPPPSRFDALYARDADPWDYRTSAYERAKYAATVAALGDRRFARVVELGCSIGELTAALAPHCDALIGVDGAQAALVTARARNAANPHVRFDRMTLPGQVPEGRFDLIVASEVLYFFHRAGLARLAAWTTEALVPEGLVLLVNWLGDAPEDPLGGEAAAEAFIAAASPHLVRDGGTRTDRYRLDRLRRPA